MRVETISTGDEVITGFIVDSNVAWLCQCLLDIGIQVSRRQTVSDKLCDIKDVITERSKYADVIIVNGGLGPTSDDNTTKAASLAANQPLVENKYWVDCLKNYCNFRKIELSKSNLKQAMIPEKAELIDNPIGTACGFKLKINKAICYFTPGVPLEFKRMVSETILPDIQNYFKPQKTIVKRYFIFGLSESKIGEKLNSFEWSPKIVLGYRVDYPTIEIKLICNNATNIEIEQSEKQLLSVIDPFLLAKDCLNLPLQISTLLGINPLQVLDSGTGGRIIQNLADEIPNILGIYQKLPNKFEDFILFIKKQNIFTLAISSTNKSFFVSFCNKDKLYIQEVKTKKQLLNKQKDLITFTALDFIRRILSRKNPFPNYENLDRLQKKIINN